MSGVVVWFTGLPSSGKTTLALAVQEQLRNRSAPVCLLDSDEIRRALVPSPSYAPEGREAFYSTLGRIAALLSKQGLVVLVAATAPRRRQRERARQLAPRFIEVFVQTSIEECRDRDAKGLYAQAERGEITDLPGVQVEYEIPASPDVITPNALSHEAVNEIVRQLEDVAEIRPDG